MVRSGSRQPYGGDLALAERSRGFEERHASSSGAAWKMAAGSASGGMLCASGRKAASSASSVRAMPSSCAGGMSSALSRAICFQSLFMFACGFIDDGCALGRGQDDHGGSEARDHALQLGAQHRPD